MSRFIRTGSWIRFFALLLCVLGASCVEQRPKLAGTWAASGMRVEFTERGGVTANFSNRSWRGRYEPIKSSAFSIELQETMGLSRTELVFERIGNKSGRLMTAEEYQRRGGSRLGVGSVSTERRTVWLKRVEPRSSDNPRRPG